MVDEHNTATNRFIMSPLFCILSLGLACLSTLFQTIAFSTHAWVVMTDFVTDNDTGQVSSVEIYTGLWYTVTCQNGACRSTTHLDTYKADIDAGRNYKEIQYSLRVWSQALTTIALLSSIVSAVSCVPFLCKPRHVLRQHLLIVVCSLISFCLLMAVIFNWTAEVSANANLEKLKTDSTRRFAFPWSLLLGGFGGSGSLVLGVIHFVFLFRSLTPSHSVRSDTFQPNAYVQLTTQTSVISQLSNESHERKHLTVEKEFLEDPIEENLAESEVDSRSLSNQSDQKMLNTEVEED
ncbi:uncharacterized protein LOC133206255 [Saccostrea echinata]|uniref:uncharacterized protein LOC133206255 n=1 Tax=Saccostrea echinata TaxID=191078 RepID=UPI002A821E8E|nr:uncharacterized protein LOC133206255 [Saccostrea echinata]XP_061198188.1 uncharacterized protein LOC133206255 [Saccostrea echinata]